MRDGGNWKQYLGRKMEDYYRVLEKSDVSRHLKARRNTRSSQK